MVTTIILTVIFIITMANSYHSSSLNHKANYDSVFGIFSAKETTDTTLNYHFP